MKGIRKKIALGFTILALLLFFAALVSAFELHRLSAATQQVLEATSRYTRLSHEMLDAAQEQNATLLKMVILGQRDLDSTFLANRAKFERALGEATVTVRDRAELDALYVAYMTYNQHVVTFAASGNPEPLDWFMSVYRTSYSDLTHAVKNYMTSSQNMLEAQAAQLRNTAYRAITPGIITLGVTILLVLVFFSLIDLYYIRPVLRINDGLRNYLANKIPFEPKIEGRDEVHQLREAIDSLIQMLKHRKQE